MVHQQLIQLQSSNSKRTLVVFLIRRICNYVQYLSVFLLLGRRVDQWYFCFLRRSAFSDVASAVYTRFIFSLY